MRFFFAAIIVPNFIFFLVSFFLGLGRPLVNFDYIFAALLLLTRFFWFGYVLLVVAVFADTLSMVSQIFPFMRLGDVFYLVGFLPQAPAAYQFAVLIGCLGFVALCYMVFHYRERGKLMHVLASMNLALAVMTFEVYGSDNSVNRFWRIAEAEPVDSQLLFFYNSRSSAFVESYSINGDPFSAAGYQPANQWSTQPAGDRLLLVINESWGVFQRPEINQAVVRGLVSSPEVSDVVSGELPFIGATVAGELRELCGLRPNHFNLRDVTAGFEHCLPNRLAALGYSTRSIHGAVGLMYDRIHWYPRAGFNKSTFFESQAWPQRCYSFPGACDSDLMKSVAEEFSQPGKRFVYWLTLNTHSIYDERDLRGVPADCLSFGLDEQSESCRSFRLQTQFFENLARLASDPSMKGVEVIVVGDHAPPIFNRHEKENYFVENKVSWVRYKIGG